MNGFLVITDNSYHQIRQIRQSAVLVISYIVQVIEGCDGL